MKTRTPALQKRFPELYKKVSGFRKCKNWFVYNKLKEWVSKLSKDSSEYQEMNRELSKFLGL